MADPEELAEKIAAKAARTLAPLTTEMSIMQWPNEFRAIMLRAVIAQAEALLNEVDNADA